MKVNLCVFAPLRENYRRRARRGVLLLVILGLLAMFGLVAVAFVVLTGQARRAAMTTQRIGQFDDPPQETLYQGLMQAVRGPNNPASAMGGHSLLQDMYANNPYQGTISGLASAVPVGAMDIRQAQVFEFDAADGNYRVGCVLTMLDGAAAGQSTLIVDVNSAGTVLRALAFEKGWPANGDSYLINGVPFSGIGFGLDPGTGQMGQLGLLPGAPQNMNPLGGANEDYDAVDFQNMLLAAQIPMYDPNTGRPMGVVTIPSLHRPALVSYWASTPGWNDPAVRRQVILRPLVEYHPGFALVNPDFDPVYGPWDVDNDGDGEVDGIWVDLGMPVRSTPDGRLYKPLFSFLCVDLDGRLNFNAHGCWAQCDPTDDTGPDGSPNGIPDLYDPITPGNNLQYAGGMPARLARGQGYGPAEINLGPLLFPLFPPRAADLVLYQQLLMGNGVFEGRYGEMGKPVIGPGWSAVDDPLSWNKSFEYRSPVEGDYWGFLSDLSSYVFDAYGTPLDLDGNGAVGLDVAGRPMYWSMGTLNEQVDDAYEFDLSRNRPHGLIYDPANPLLVAPPPDNPFGVAELERLLRPFDRDSSKLPARLVALTYDGVSGSVLHPWRHALTTESWGLPCPSVALSEGVYARGEPVHVGSVLRAGAGVGVAPGYWKRLLAPEVLAGRRMDLNRPFGNGRDDNGNKVVDEPGETLSGEQLVLFTQAPPSPTENVAFSPLANPMDLAASDVDVDGKVDGEDVTNVRELYARHLYVLMMGVTEGVTSEEKAREIAQWAVNVVDFRDRDSIMTRFCYDVNPFNGWSPDRTAGHTVWGCERPELLITETLAFHARRTEDTEDEKWDGKGPEEEAGKHYDEEDEKKKDKDLDQRHRPQGSLFVELMNPWTRMEPPAGELYGLGPSGAGVELTRVSSGGAGTASPVWRLIIIDPNAADQPAPVDAGEHHDPDDPEYHDATGLSELVIERAVYFTNIAGLRTPDVDGVEFFASRNVADLVYPGRYAVIGPGTPGNGKTYIGFEENKESGVPTTTRHIDLLVANPNLVRNNGNDEKSTDQIYRPAVVVVDKARRGDAVSETRLSVSEPFEEDYDELAADEGSGINGDLCEPVIDVPLDSKREEWEELWGKDQTAMNYRIVHLQRLANPLIPWHPITNPYRTIDSAPVDLTVFNGASSRREPGIGAGTVRFVSRQRGEREQRGVAGNVLVNNLWKQEPADKTLGSDTTPGLTGPTGHYFDKPLGHSLGHLSDFFGEPISDANGLYKGDPPQPFPWLTWNNRPFVSHLELLLVPKDRSSKLLVRNMSGDGERWHYRFVKPNETAAVSPYTTGGVPYYPHLLNFFLSGGGSPQLHRLLEYVQVPSRFVGTTVQANPIACSGGDHSFYPPFNRISRYREPGRINLNTIFSPEVFWGLMNGTPAMSDLRFWDELMWSRRKYGGPTPLGGDPVSDKNAIQQAMLQIDPGFPTRFGCPFRSFGGGKTAPLGILTSNREIDATLLRSDPQNHNRPLFHYQSVPVMPNVPVPDDTDRNPYFRYQGLQRLGNLVTTRSNVYAIWITVGYFEVERAPMPPNHPSIASAAEYWSVYPGGYWLKGELGLETGEVKRHRAFYIFDRSIPVGFKRGEDLNVENALLLKRFIE